MALPTPAIRNKYKRYSKKLQDDVDDIHKKYLNSSSILLVKYYNQLKKITITVNDEEYNLLDYLKEQKRRNKFNISINTEEIIKLYQTLEDTLMEDFIEMLEDVYKLTAVTITKRYGRRKYPISNITFYEEDGMTMIERLRRWFCPFTLHQDLDNPNDSPTPDKLNFDFYTDKLQAIDWLDKILYTECLYQQTTVQKDKLSGFCEWVEICFGGGECRSDCESYCGEFPVNEVPAWPPFHTYCGCYASFILSDELEDVEDLDLEDDLDEEYYEDEIEEIEQE